MKMPIKMSTVANWAAFGLATFIVSTTIIFAYLLLSPVDVLTNWAIKVEEKVYHPTDEITLHTQYTKLRNVPSTAYYYLECRNKNGNLARYLINISEGNRPAGSGKVDQNLRLPVIVPDLPKQCRIAVTVDYTMYSFRRFTENTNTNWFTVEEREGK